MHNTILVLGAGGHGKVVADVLMNQGVAPKGFLDDAPILLGQFVIGIPVLDKIDNWLIYTADGMVLGIGSNSQRRMIVERLGDRANALWQDAIHPKSILSSWIQVGHGTVIVGGAVINADSVIGRHVIVNTSATIDHDCRIGDYAHIGPGSHLAGGVSVGEGALIGMGANVISGCSIGKWAIIGAGAVVIHDIPDAVTAKGVPARW